MKVSPLSQGSGIPSADVGAVSTGRTSPDRLAAAKAVAQGRAPEVNNDPQVERLQQNVRKIKMRTQVSPDRVDESLVQEPVVEASAENNAISDASEQSTTQEAEATKPLSPQFAALAKQKRALQLKEREIEEREKALGNRTPAEGSGVDLARLKSDPLGVMAEAGVSYEQLTEAILGGQANPEIADLKAQIKSLREGIDKNFVDRDTQAEQQVLGEMKREADRFVAEGDDFALVRETKSTQKAIDLIHQIYKKDGEVLDVREALELIETELIEDSLRYARIPKIQSKLTPAQENQTQQQSVPGQRQMTTLSNRDGARPVLDKRARALAAFHGTLNKR